MKSLLFILILTVSISLISCGGIQRIEKPEPTVTIGWEMPTLLK